MPETRLEQCGYIPEMTAGSNVEQRAELVITDRTDGNTPQLRINVIQEGHEKEPTYDAVSIVHGWENIDALRRHCEMVLAHFNHNQARRQE